MRMNCRYVVAALVALTAAACQDDETVLSPGENARVEVSSDPSGASVEVDGTSIGRTTPTTIFDLVGRHEIVVKLDADNITYGYRTEVDVRGDSLHRVNGPLMFRCVTTNCLLASYRNRVFGRMRIATQANGALFMKQAQGEGLQWPLGSSNSYVSNGLPLIAMLSGARDTLALGIYDFAYLSGRPQPVFQTAGDVSTLRQTAWIIPPAITNLQTVRGIEVEEEIIGRADSDVIFLKLTFRNITNRESYRAADPLMPNTGMSFDHVYIGFGLDADIGTATDDMITYEPALDMVYAYDSNFLEEIFSSGSAAAPGLIGLKVVEAPANTTKVLNAWPASLGAASDWVAGTNSEREGYGVISGLRSFAPDQAGQQIGFVASRPADYRMSVSAGPVTLAPGDAASITVALIMASPVDGQYFSSQTVAPGSPMAEDRQIRRIAATLLDRARTLVAP